MEYTSYHDLKGLKLGVAILLHGNAHRPQCSSPPASFLFDVWIVCFNATSIPEICHLLAFNASAASDSLRFAAACLRASCLRNFAKFQVLATLLLGRKKLVCTCSSKISWCRI